MTTITTNNADNIDWGLVYKNESVISNMATLSILLIQEIVGHDISSTINNEELCRESIARHVRSVICKHFVTTDN